MEAYNEMHREALDCIYKAEAALQAYASQEEQAARDNAEKLAAYEAELMAE